MLINFQTTDTLNSHHGMALVEGARRYCVDRMPMRTKKDARAYIFTMESLQGAEWDIIRSQDWYKNRKAGA